jgi:acylpyruvate hydrolase
MLTSRASLVPDAAGAGTLVGSCGNGELVFRAARPPPDDEPKGTPMKIARYLHDGFERVGIIHGDVICEVDYSLRDLLVAAALGVQEADIAVSGTTLAIDNVTMLAPVVPGGRIFCVGINYLEHKRESADVFVADVPSEPIVFLKDISAITGPFAQLRLPKNVSEQFDWEVELAVVIGAPSREVSTSEAASAIAGYTVVNDVTARDLQTKHVQWTLGKNNVAATPVGPWIVTKDELGDDLDLDITLTVNGETMQSGNTREMLFGVPLLIATISAVTPLLPGDVIATGTPSGVGFKRTPPRFLQDGDTVECTIERLGVQRNTVTTRS